MSKQEVIKHSASIQINNVITLLQRKAWNILLANAYDKLLEKDVFTMDMKDLLNQLGLDNNSYTAIKGILRALNSFQIEWNLLDKDKQESCGVTNFIAGCEIENGKITYGYYPGLKKKLYNPRMYARISLSMQNKFKSKHALALYELCVDYYNVERAFGETPWIFLDVFRKLMGLSEDEYQEFKYLRKRLIDAPLKEINEVSDLFVEVDTKMEGKRVAALKFKIHKKENAALPSPAPDLFVVSLKDRLIKFGVFHVVANDLIKRFDADLIKDWLDCIEQGYQKGVLDGPAFLVAALDEEYAFPKMFLKKKNEEQLQQVELKKEKRY